MDSEAQLDNSSADTEHAPEAPKPHEFLWFRDGNIVLATDAYLFKVHESLLSLHSSVFKDMFDLPGVDGLPMIAGQSSVEMVPDLYEGLPMVTLVGDEGDEVVHLLRAIYERQ